MITRLLTWAIAGWFLATPFVLFGLFVAALVANRSDYLVTTAVMSVVYVVSLLLAFKAYEIISKDFIKDNDNLNCSKKSFKVIK